MEIFTSINGKTKIIGLFGDPVSHSFSPAMYNAAFRECALNYCYVPFRVCKQDLPAAMHAITALDLIGVNITAPHKEAAVNMLHALSPEVEFLNAVNTVLNVKSKLIGYNTDVYGFTYLLNDTFKTAFIEVCLLGAGGAARAVALSLAKTGLKKLFILNRTLEKGEKLARKLCQSGLLAARNIEILPLEKDKIRKAFYGTLVVNGLSEDPVELGLVIPSDIFNSGAVIDLRYNPPCPPILQAARACGVPFENGLKMLLGQGLKAFELFTGGEPPLRVMQGVLRMTEQFAKNEHV